MRIYYTINRTSYYSLSFTSVTFHSHFSLSTYPPCYPFLFHVLSLFANIYIPRTDRSFYFSDGPNVKWKRVGFVSGRSVRLDTIIWPGGDLSVAAVSSRARTVFRVVTALAPPFVMESELDEDGQCLRGN